MDNVLLGKTMKAMYKLSGKTLTQLSDETDLTIDTINNLFYARLQKPGFIGVSALVKATGHTAAELDGFLAYAEGLPADADITEEFTKYLFSVKDTVPDAAGTVPDPAPAAAADLRESDSVIRALNEEHERQLERYRTLHLHYVEQLHIQYKEEIGQIEDSVRRLKELYDHSVSEIKKTHQEELLREEKENSSLKRMNQLLTAALIVVAVGAVVIAIVIKG